METAASVLLAARDEASHIVLLEDDVDAYGQPAILEQVARSVTDGSRLGQARHLVLIGSPTCTFQIKRALSEQCSISTVLPLQHQGPELEKSEGGLQPLLDQIRVVTKDRSCIILESLTDLLITHDLAEVCTFLENLQQLKVGGILGCLHTDVIPSATVFALEQLARARLQVCSTFDGLKTLGFPQHYRVDGTIVLHEKKRTGRVSIKQHWFQLQGDDKLLFVSQLKDPDLQLPKARSQQIGSTKIAEQAGMRHTLNAEELAARGSVALPHMRISKTQETVELEPNQAGAPLGQIHYVRDSESDYDSDEDPDNDLDI